MSQGFLHGSQSASLSEPPTEAAATCCPDSPQVPPQHKAWQKDTAVKQASKVSACADTAGSGAVRASSYLQT